MKKFIYIALFLCLATPAVAQKTYINEYGEKCWFLWKFKNGEDTTMIVLVEDESMKPQDFAILKRLRTMSVSQIKSQAAKWTNAGRRIEAFPYRKEDFEKF